MKEIAAAGAELIAETAIDFAIANKIKLSIGNTQTNSIGSKVTSDDQRTDGISQIILKKCYYSNSNEFDVNPYRRVIQIESDSLSIDLDPSRSDVNAILLTILGKQLNDFQAELKNLYQNHIYLNNSNHKVEILYPIQFEDHVITLFKALRINP